MPRTTVAKSKVVVTNVDANTTMTLDDEEISLTDMNSGCTFAMSTGYSVKLQGNTARVTLTTETSPDRESRRNRH